MELLDNFVLFSYFIFRFIFCKNFIEIINFYNKNFILHEKSFKSVEIEEVFTQTEKNIKWIVKFQKRVSY